ncbi:hypothetical protein ACH5RR_026707 [Cinchona calisaya]|uniref:Uncharacterized protein n=1 Tax=Cinchona calisaya TaxID=153742 RepID=A0ABD2Z6R3_9GENT
MLRSFLDRPEHPPRTYKKIFTSQLFVWEAQHWRCLTDDLGAESMMMDALDKVEEELKKPLMRNDKKGMALLVTEFGKRMKKCLAEVSLWISETSFEADTL